MEYKLVPVEPTEEMIDAALLALGKSLSARNVILDANAAAPCPWTKVEDGLPFSEGRFQVGINTELGFHQETASYHPDNNYQGFEGWSDITHWMPLLEGPQ